MKRATISTVCECQAKLSAELDEKRFALHGTARDRRSGKQLIAPAHSIDAAQPKFQVAWACPFCTRNQLRSFDAAGLVYRDVHTASA